MSLILNEKVFNLQSSVKEWCKSNNLKFWEIKSIKNSICFEDVLSDLIEGKDINERLGDIDTEVREAIFWGLSRITNRPYEVFCGMYYGTENESVLSMNDFYETSKDYTLVEELSLIVQMNIDGAVFLKLSFDPEWIFHIYSPNAFALWSIVVPKKDKKKIIPVIMNNMKKNGYEINKNKFIVTDLEHYNDMKEKGPEYFMQYYNCKNLGATTVETIDIKGYNKYW